MEKKTIKVALIIGAGPGGLTAAHELLTRTEIKPIIFERLDEIGGISRTVNYKVSKESGKYAKLEMGVFGKNQRLIIEIVNPKIIQNIDSLRNRKIYFLGKLNKQSNDWTIKVSKTEQLLNYRK